MNDRLTKIREKYKGPPIATRPTATGHMLVGLHEARKWASTDEGKICIEFDEVFAEIERLELELADLRAA